MKTVLIVSISIFSLLLASCTQPDRSLEILRSEGYQNVEITGYEIWGCSDDDWFRTGFKATRGDRQVKGVVCSGFLKGATVRITN